MAGFLQVYVVLIDPLWQESALLCKIDKKIGQGMPVDD